MKVLLEKVSELARRAREEHPRVGDVRDAVLERMRTSRNRQVSEAPLLVFTLAYATASVVMCTVAVGLSVAASDPLAPLFALAQTFTY